MMNATVKELLTENKKALQMLHYVDGYDFTKPFDIYKGTGSFTANSIKKMIECSSDGVTPVSDNTVSILIKRSEHYNTKLHYVKLGHSVFKTKFSNRYIHSWLFDVETFNTTGSFENTRKKTTDTYYVIVQKSEYLTEHHKEATVDLTDRCFNIHRNYGRANFTQNNNKFALDRGIDIFDKSGYYMPGVHSEYERRVKNLKSERAKVSADKFNYTTYLEKIANIKTEIKKYMLDAVAKDELDVITNVSYSYRSLFRDIERFEKKAAEKTFTTIDNIDYSYSNIIRDTNKLLNKFKADCRYAY